ncbi:unnamed protein product [Durusdinium trenchii]|uniref:Phosphatidic acid phosphatase type 2/haloperoxidase domain-containing protein n=1 Tax=Durusdinium trenchii TaxID=1381693 RepID=A0ABP0RE49_9DINO
MALRRAAQDDDIESQSTEKDESFAVGQVTIRLPLDLNPLSLMALVLSFLPWAVPILLLADGILSRRISSGFALGAIILTSLVSELILKPLIAEPRPPTSACRTEDGKLLPGMPSGHVMICQSMLTFYALEAMRHHLLVAALILILCMPLMPWARWYNGDHTLKQVAVTFVVAAVVGLLDFLIFLALFDDGGHDPQKVLFTEVASIPTPGVILGAHQG